MSNLLNDIIKIIFFHPKCVICEKFGSHLCAQCKNKLDSAFNPTIVRTSHQELLCASSFVYEGDIKKIIHKYKFQGQKNLYKILSPFLEITVRKIFKDQQFDLVTSVPMHYSALDDREYNQSEMLAVDLAKRLNVPYERCLIKIKKNRVQHGLSFKDRQLNVQGVYKAVKRYDNKKIFLCDDIITTGATLFQCSNSLAHPGTSRFLVTLARVARV